MKTKTNKHKKQHITKPCNKKACHRIIPQNTATTYLDKYDRCCRYGDAEEPDARI